MKQHDLFRRNLGGPTAGWLLSNGLCLQKFPQQKLGETICRYTWLTTWLRKWQVNRPSLIYELTVKSPCGPASCAVCHIQLLHRHVLPFDTVHQEGHQRTRKPCCKASICVCHLWSPELCPQDPWERLDHVTCALTFLSPCPWFLCAWAHEAVEGPLLCACWHCSDWLWEMAWKVMRWPVVTGES